jgi:hypothetical protein
MAKKKHETIEAFEAKIEAYYKKQIAAKRPLTIEGLCLALNFNSRQSLLNYEGYTDKNKKPFLDAIKKARLYIQQSKIEGLLSGDYSTAGAIFDLKNNHNYKDKQETTLKIDKEALTDAELNEQIKRFESRNKDNK